MQAPAVHARQHCCWVRGPFIHARTQFTPSSLTPSPSGILNTGGEEVTVPAMLPVMGSTPGGTRWAGPELGEHTEEILQTELGLDDVEIARLRECGAI